MSYNFVLIGLIFILYNFINNANGDAPNFVSARGLRVRSSTQLNNQLYAVFVSSQEVRGDQEIRILFPPDYATSGGCRRYPVLYLLHGAFDNASEWTTYGAAESVCGNQSLITVMPNADPFGQYTNWVNPGNATPQNWRTFHMEQVVPWIDFNLRTVRKKEGRAIAGVSMGGYGAIHYAELYPSNFIYAASLSGALDLLDPRIQQLIIGLPYNGEPFLGPFGSPNASLPFNQWYAQATTTRAAELRNVYVALYVGNGDEIESLLRDGNYRLRDVLNSLNISLYFNDYGNGQSIGNGCNGGHVWECGNAALADVVPRIMAVLKQQFKKKYIFTKSKRSIR